MKLTVNTNRLALIDRVVEAGMLGKSRGDVLKGAVIEHACFLLAGGTPFRTGPPGFVEVQSGILICANPGQRFDALLINRL
jgi:hypothetical protein